jgi:cell division protein FtsB
MIAKKRKKRNFHQNIILPLLFGFFILGILSLFIFYNFKINQKRQKLLSQIRELEKEIRVLEEKNAQLEAGISQTEKEAYWEEVVRQQGFVKEGEEQIVVLPPESQEVEEEEKKSFWNLQSWWEKVINWVNKVRD